MMKRVWTLLFLLSCVGAALASGPGAVRKQVESSLLVQGTIDINADGTVASHALEQQDELPPGIVDMVARAAPQWRFEPVSLAVGTTIARADMSLRFVARKLDDGSFAVQIRSARFGQYKAGESVSASSLQPPAYPKAAVSAGVTGTVYVIVKIGRDGKVVDAVAEQVNLRVIASENTMRQWRGVLAQSALRAAKKWTFDAPTQGDAVDEPFWSVRVPVAFSLASRQQQDFLAENQWQAYVPGPRQGIPWAPNETGVGADAIATGGVYPLQNGLKLLTQLGPG